jgi:pimeloyl-ACP methyl ester carboxylesterase
MFYSPLIAPRTHRISLRGITHQVTQWGPESASPVFLLHGWGDCGETFQFLVDACSPQRRWVAIDWRGFGGSQWTGPAYWFPDYLADLETFLDQYSPGEPASLVGHSMGGNIASLYAGVRPERVARLINLEGIGLPRTDPVAAPGRYRRWLDELSAPKGYSVYESVEYFAQLLVRRNPRLPKERAGFIASLWLTPCDGGWTVRWDPAHKHVNPVLYSREAAAACWAACTAPTLLVLGGRSDIRLGLGEDGEPSAYAEMSPDVRLHLMPEAGHMMHHEEPEALAAVVEAFLDGIP